MLKFFIVDLIVIALVIGFFVVGSEALIIHGNNIAASLESSTRLFDLR